MGTRLPRGLGVCGLLVASTMLSTCGGGADTAGPLPPATSSPSTSSATTSPTIEGTRVSAQLTEFSIALDTTTFPPGTYTFIAQERGKVAHALSIEGPGLKTTSTAVLSPGDADAALAVDLEPGTYTLWCPVGTHRDQGMEATITVG